LDGSVNKTARATGTPGLALAIPIASVIMVAAPGPAAAQAQQAPSLLPPPAQSHAPAAYLLRAVKDGAFSYEEEAWRATIAEDGSVRFVDRHVTIDNLSLGPIKYRSVPKSGVPSLWTWLHEGGGHNVPPDPWTTMRAPISPYHADPRAGCLQRDACFLVPIGPDAASVGVGGVLDLTDEYMRWMKQDPYRRDKARFLAATFEMRVNMAARHHARLTRASLIELPARLETLWADPARPPVEKRHLLWSLWTEMSDAGEGAAARATIERFIRQRLPRGSPDAFSDAELATFGAAGAFAPYGK
jgi:hypothetical protein